MPQQLIYTSAPRGVVAGRSGHCTVARSATMREALMLQLEKLSYYQHLSLSGGQERPIYSCRVVDIRGSRYHVLSRIQDSGLDFTGRTNFLAHHLVFTPEEIRQFPSPPVILRGWSGWMKSWSKEPQLLENEDWSGLAALSNSVSVPATTWQQVTGDAVNGYGLLEARAGIAFPVDGLAEEKILALFAESLELLELRDPRRDFRATAWQYTFTTSMQEQDNPADFRWRCLHSDNPASNRFAGPDCRPLFDVRALRVTSEETLFARSGRQPPCFVSQPQNVRSTEGETARLHAKAEGVPSPSYQWFAVDRAGNGQIVASGTDAELVVQNPPLGLSRYVVRASNSQGDVTSEVATLSVEQKLRLSQSRPVSEAHSPAKPASPSYVKSADDIERQRRRLEAEQAQVMFQKGLRRKKVLGICGVILGLAVLCGFFLSRMHQSSGDSNVTKPTNAVALADALATNSPSQTNSTIVPNMPLQDDAAAANVTPTDRQPRLPKGIDLPFGWTKKPIGDVSYFNGDNIGAKPTSEFVLTTAAVGFFTNADHFFFVYKANAGQEFQVSVSKIDPPSTVSESGIMIRESVKPDSAFLFIGVSPQKIIARRRDGKGGVITNEKAIPKNKQGIRVLLKFDQKDNQFTPGFAFEPKKWDSSTFTNCALTKGEQMLVGFAVSSGNASNRVTARFLELPPEK